MAAGILQNYISCVCGCVHVCMGVVRGSLSVIAWGMKLVQNLAVLVCMLQCLLPEGRRVKPLMILVALFLWHFWHIPCIDKFHSCLFWHPHQPPQAFVLRRCICCMQSSYCWTLLAREERPCQVVSDVYTRELSAVD